MMLEAFMTSQKKQMEELSTKVELLATQNKLLETQVAQQAVQSAWQLGTLPPKPDPNPKDIKAVRHTLRSGAAYEDPSIPIDVQVRASDEVEQHKEDKHISTSQDQASKDSPRTPGSKDASAKVSTEVPRYVPPHRYAPFPSRLLKDNDKTEKQFSKFIEVLKQLHINLPLIEVITQMPIYAKFFKDILSNRRKLEEVQVVSLANLPKKLDDPGKFVIPCSIGNLQFKCALCDLGASVSLMPMSIFEKIGVGELKPTQISLQLADQSVKLPIGVVEDMSIQIGKYFVPIDFVIVDMEEDAQTPLLLGRHFLNTAKAVIDVHEGMISFKIGEEKIIFRVNRAL
jgi:gag-polyprotein putative aspartyl protease